MSRKSAAFSMAELLLALLVVSIIVSATIPTFTKKSSTNEQVFKWSQNNGSGYSIAEPIIIGANRLQTTANIDSDSTEGSEDDKLSIVKRIDDANDNDYAEDSFITMYDYPRTGTYNQMQNRGRLFTDAFNLGLGFHSLNQMERPNDGTGAVNNPTFRNKYNTAFGHRTVADIPDGIAAVGDSASGNTAIGYGSLGVANNLDIRTTVDNIATNSAGQNLHAAFGYRGANTALGAFALSNALANNSYANSNVAVGPLSLYRFRGGAPTTSGGVTTQWDYGNVAVGAKSLANLERGSGNIAIGLEASRDLTEGHNNIAIGIQALNTGTNNSSNIAIGTSALTAIPSDSELNTAVGHHSTTSVVGDYEPLHPTGTFTSNFGHSATSGNTGIGAYSLSHNGNHLFNTAVGTSALYAPQGDFDHNANTAVGFHAMSGQNTPSISAATDFHGYFGNGSTNVAVGAYALNKVGRATSNVAIGPLAMYNFEGTDTTFGDYGNIAVGSKSLADLTSGQNNIAIGVEAAGDMSKGHNNIAIGFQALNTYDGGGTPGGSGGDNLAIGSQALASLEYGNNNIVIGNNAFNWARGSSTSNTVANNVIIGKSTATGITTGGSGGNVIIGGDTAQSLPSPSSRNIIIGSNFNPSGSAINDRFLVGTNGGTALLDGTMSGTRSLTVNGNLSSTGKVTIAGDLEVTGNIKYRNGSSWVTLNGHTHALTLTLEGTSYYDCTPCGLYCCTPLKKNFDWHTHTGTATTISVISSDIRLKDNISDNTAGLKEINQLEVKNYTYKKDETKTPHVGVIAQSLKKVFPNAVKADEDGYLMIRWEDMFYAMINAIKELHVQLQDITAKITGLDKRITLLEKKNKNLKKRISKLEKKQAKKAKKKKSNGIAKTTNEHVFARSGFSVG